MGGILGRLTTAGNALAATFHNPNLRRLQLANIGSVLGSMSAWVAVSVYAYDKGGSSAVAAVFVFAMLPAAVASSFVASVADRFSRTRVMACSDLARAVFMGVMVALIALDSSIWVFYPIVALSGIAGTAFGPARAALLPQLAETPTELTAANVAWSTIESAGSFVGPAIGGFLVAATSPELVIGLNGVSFVWSALLILRVRDASPAGEGVGGEEPEPFLASITAGFRAIFGNVDVRSLVALYAAQTLVAGTLGVLIVVTAFEILEGGAKEVGILDAAVGIGGLAGSFVALALSVRGRLAAVFALGLLCFGGLTIAGLAASIVPVVAGLALLGVGNSLVDIAAITLLQRAVADAVLGRVFGALESVLLACVGVGTLVAPLLVHLAGADSTMIVTGAVLPLLAVLTWPLLRGIDARAPEPAGIELLRRVALLTALPPATLERLAGALVEVRLPAGATVIRAGEEGDRFYIVEDGVVDIEGQSFGPESSFGEIALLRDVPRTATVTAHTDVILQALERDDFLAAVTQHESSLAAAEAVVALRLGELRTA